MQSKAVITILLILFIASGKKQEFTGKNEITFEKEFNEEKQYQQEILCSEYNEFYRSGFGSIEFW